MALANSEWANRIGIVQVLFDAAEPDKRVRYMAMLTIWRWRIFNRRDDWCRDVDKLAVQPGERGRFWSELRHKKYGLYGSSAGTDADPMALVRHPWSLRTYEFEQAFNQIVKDQTVPSNVPDDRARYGAVAGIAGGAVGTVGAGLSVALPPAGAAIAVVGGGIVAVGAGLDERADLLDASQKKKITANMDSYIAIYKREADFRVREVVPGTGY